MPSKPNVRQIKAGHLSRLHIIGAIAMQTALHAQCVTTIFLCRADPVKRNALINLYYKTIDYELFCEGVAKCLLLIFTCVHLCVSFAGRAACVHGLFRFAGWC